MKIILIILIISLSGITGFCIKNKYVKQLQIYQILINFFEYYLTSISIFKNNIQEIILNYKLINKNKNALYDNIFKNNDNLFQINKEFIFENINEKETKLILETTINSMGSANIEIEEDKIKSLITFLNKKKQQAEEKVNKEGNLYFKLSLAAGAVISIIIWWVYGCYNFI